MVLKKIQKKKESDKNKTQLNFLEKKQIEERRNFQEKTQNLKTDY